MTVPFTQYRQQLEALLDCPVVLFFNDDRPATTKLFEEDDVDVLYACLQSIGRVQRLAIVLHAMGGRVGVSRKMHTLLRSYAEDITVFVPRKARSAGTLLCLGANRIVMTAVAELSPLDPHITAQGDSSSGQPLSISAEDIRAFRHMAEDWFDLRSEEGRAHVFQMLATHIFPTTLSAFYRADKHMRQIAEELLSCQLSDTAVDTRRMIVERLVGGYHAHDYNITCAEAVELGLCATRAPTQEEALLMALWKACRAYCDTIIADRNDHAVMWRPNGILASADFQAHYVAFAGCNSSDELQQEPVSRVFSPHWDIDAMPG
jgi:hypothetical protein